MMKRRQSISKDVPMSSIGVPLRKRTEKACDQCRRRKTKCDGKSCCKACSEFGLECSYGHRMRQSRGPAYVAHLETRLKEFETETEVRKVNAHPFDQSGVVSTPDSHDASLVQSPDSMRAYSSDSSGSSQPDTTHERKRSTNDILNDAKEVLDQMSPHNYTAKCAAHCLGALNQDLRDVPMVSSKSEYDFSLYGSTTGGLPTHSMFDPIDPFQQNMLDNSLYGSGMIDPAATFAPSNDYTWMNGGFGNAGTGFHPESAA